jgi:hypothetical protein
LRGRPVNEIEEVAIYKIFLIAPIVLSLLSCGGLGTLTPTDSGITGQALVGPVCPVVIEEKDCSDQPYQATITVNSLEGGEIVRFQTDEDGNFHVPLPPGKYILHPETPPDMPLPFGEEQRFTVLPGAYTRLIVLYDSGIR